MSENILKLSKTLKSLDGKEIKDLTFQEMTVGDLIEYDIKDFTKVKTVIEITSRLTGNEYSILLKLSPKDLFSCFNLVNGFFGFSPEIQMK